ncbi:hypothetical protein QBC40DRAFT_258919 [Triangularia verruculosa]|uniref:Uncharacterized protein n=1 Tax=Triangularia verruculosa TaxID=2587418 RepID=A0AAN6X9I0_9PEZI|nr:hypothetical protein QBC40DRAFT_258919 [Triangularia verruculosa]
MALESYSDLLKEIPRLQMALNALERSQAISAESGMMTLFANLKVRLQAFAEVLAECAGQIEAQAQQHDADALSLKEQQTLLKIQIKDHVKSLFVESLREQAEAEDGVKMQVIQNAIDKLGPFWDEKIAQRDELLQEKLGSLVEVRQDIQNLSETVTKLNGDVTGGQAAVADLKETVTRLEATVAGRDVAIAGHNETVTKLNGDVSERDTTVADLKETVTRLEAMVAGRDVAIAVLNETVTRLQATVAENEISVAGLSGDVSERDSTIAGLKDSLAAFHGKMEALETEVAHRDDSIKRLQDELDAAKLVAQCLQDKLAACQSTYDNVKSQLGRELADSEAVNTQLHDALSESEAVKAQLTEALATAKSDLSEARALAESHDKKCAELAVALKAEEEANPRKRRRLNDGPEELSNQETWERIVYEMADELATVTPELEGPDVLTHKRVLYDLSAIPNVDAYRDNWNRLLQEGPADEWHCVVNCLDRGHHAAPLFISNDGDALCPGHENRECLVVKVFRGVDTPVRTVFSLIAS